MYTVKDGKKGTTVEPVEPTNRGNATDTVAGATTGGVPIVAANVSAMNAT